MITAIRRLLVHDRSGTALIEAGVAIPILVTLLLGAVDVVRYVLLNQKMERTAVTLSDLVSQEEALTENEVADFMNAIPFIMSPFNPGSNGDLGPKGRVFVSGIERDGANPPTIVWQRSGAGSYSATSQIGVQGGSPTLPASFTLEEDEAVIVAEVFYDYEPILFVDLAAHEVHHQAFFRPRFGDLETPTP